MGNVTQCMAGKLSARVMRPDGYILEYDYGIQVAMLMTLFPGNLVIHCSTDPVHPGERRQFKVMDIADRVRLGQSYMIYPIPPQYIELFKPPPIQTEGMSGSRYLDLRLTLRSFIKSKKVKRTRRSRFWRLKIIARSFLSLFAFRASSQVPGKLMPDEECVPLMNMDGTDHSFTSAYGRTREKKRPGRTGDLSVWKPDLEDIPEDPRGYCYLPKCAHEEVQRFKLPSSDRLLPPKIDEGLGSRIGKISTSILPTVGLTDIYRLSEPHKPKCGYGEVQQFKSPSSDRLLQPKIDEGLGPRIGKITTTMLSTVCSTDFNRVFSKPHAWHLHPGFQVTPDCKSSEIFPGFESESLLTQPALG